MDYRNSLINATSLENRAALDKLFTDNANKLVDWAISNAENGAPTGNPNKIFQILFGRPNTDMNGPDT
jgi:hypothetical protein